MDLSSKLARVTRLAERLEGAWLALMAIMALYLWFAPTDNWRDARVAASGARSADEVRPSAREEQPESLAGALKIIWSKKLVDLTHSFSPTSPVWAGFGQATMSAAADPKTHHAYTIEQDGFRATFYSMVGQYGTHVDPPAHFSNVGLTMDQIPLDQMILPLIVFDMTPMLKSDPNHAFGVTDVQAWERVHGEVPAGPFVALRTDMSKDFERNPERPDRSHGEPGPGAGDRRGHCRDVAEGGERPGLPGEGVRHTALGATNCANRANYGARPLGVGTSLAATNLGGENTLSGGSSPS